MTTDDPRGFRELSKPPPRDMRLLDHFTDHDIAAKSNAYERTGSGSPDPERALINSGSVGFRQHTEEELYRRLEGTIENEGSKERALRPERVSRAQRQRDTGAIIELMPPDYVDVLRRAFGPQDQLPYMFVRLHEDEASRKRDNLGAISASQKRERLGPWRQVLPLTATVRAEYVAHVKRIRDEARQDAERLERDLRSVAEVERGRLAARVDRARALVAAAKENETVLGANVADEPETDEKEALIAGAVGFTERARRRLDIAKQRVADHEQDHVAALAVAGQRIDKQAPAIGIETFIVDVMTADTFAKKLSAAQDEAFELVAIAWNDWADLRGRRPRSERLEEPEDLR